MVELFGGNIICTLPSTVIDVSGFRQVPDNQEVFLLESNTDKSIIIELLESPDTDIERLLKLHLSDVLETDPDEVNLNYKQLKSCYILQNDKITLGLRRIEKYNVDILMTIGKVSTKDQGDNILNLQDFSENESIIVTGLSTLEIVNDKLFG